MTAYFSFYISLSCLFLLSADLNDAALNSRNTICADFPPLNCHSISNIKAQRGAHFGNRLITIHREPGELQLWLYFFGWMQRSIFQLIFHFFSPLSYTSDIRLHSRCPFSAFIINLTTKRASRCYNKTTNVSSWVKTSSVPQTSKPWWNKIPELWHLFYYESCFGTNRYNR